jgi:hypothetical protein
MSAKMTSVEEDLAFMRALVQPDDAFQRTFGQSYFAAGLCYSVQMLLHGLQTLGWGQQAPVAMAIGLGPTVIFLAMLAWILGRSRNRRPVGTVGKAVGAVFGAVGIANLFLIVVIGSLAWREQSLTIWLIYPCVVMVLQGAAWMVAYTLRRRAWLGLVAFGWFFTGIAMAFAIGSGLAFIAAAGIGMFAFMLVPGAVLMRRPGA